jgi:hypothetical protein
MKAMMNQVHLLAMVAIEIVPYRTTKCLRDQPRSVSKIFQIHIYIHTINFGIVGFARPAQSGGETYALATSDHDGDGTLDGTLKSRRKKREGVSYHKYSTYYYQQEQHKKSPFRRLSCC